MLANGYLCIRNKQNYYTQKNPRPYNYNAMTGVQLLYPIAGASTCCYKLTI